MLVWERLIQPWRERKAEHDAVFTVRDGANGNGQDGKGGSIRDGDIPPVA